MGYDIVMINSTASTLEHHDGTISGEVCSNIVSKNFMDIQVYDLKGIGLSGATVKVYDNNNLTFVGYTNQNGHINDILVTDMERYGRETFDNQTNVEVLYNNLPFYNNNRSVNMSSWKCVEFQPDTTPPQIISSSPTGNRVEVDTVVSVQFSKCMNQTLTENAFELKSVDLVQISGTFEWNSDSEQVFFTPLGYLEYNTTYNITIEITAKDITNTSFDNVQSWIFITQTIDEADTDGDGLSDGWEFDYGLDPYDDTDASNDSDNDGFSNIQEYMAGAEPNNPQSTPDDTDGDGLPDIWEIEHFGVLTQNASNDPDTDGFSNIQEYLADTEPDNNNSRPSMNDSIWVDYWYVILIVLILLISTFTFYRKFHKIPKENQRLDEETTNK